MADNQYFRDSIGHVLQLFTTVSDCKLSLASSRISAGERTQNKSSCERWAWRASGDNQSRQ